MTKSPSSTPDFSVREFFKRFPDDEACLDHIFAVRFGERHVCKACGAESSFHRMSKRRAWACAACGDHIYPTAGTIFQDTRTPLQVWFYAIYLFVTTRHGVSGKELQRQLGVTYKTAWRIGHKIREQMEKHDFKGFLGGHVEADETFVGGKAVGMGSGYKGNKTIVMGMKERNGPVRATVVEDVSQESLKKVILENVEVGSAVSTDELRSYNLLESEGYEHGRVNHAAKQWARFDPARGDTYCTNEIEGFWRMLKVSIRSTHIHVSPQHMQKYINEFTFRTNYRGEVNRMFDRLIAAF